MIESSTFVRRSLHIVALALSSAVIAVSATPASARSHHGSGHHAHHASHHAHHYSHHASHHARRHAHAHHGRRYTRASRFERSAAAIRTRGLEGSQASLMAGSASSGPAMSSGFGGSGVVAEARRYIGGNPTGRGRLWCARFMNLVLERTGHRGTGSDMARSFAHYGQRVSGPQVGAIAVMARRGGGHVGVVSGIDAQGNPIVISGNYGHRVREVPMSRGRIYAYVMPN
jgi:uncharacterized protein (TIGR02594 family)